MVDIMVESMMAAAITIGGFAVTPPPPTVQIISSDTMRALYCKDVRCIPPAGLYLPRFPTVVWLSDWDGQSTIERSILLHEIVHYLQYKSGAWETVKTCQDWLRLELQAFDIQEKWLATYYIYLPQFSRLRAMYASQCKEDGK